MDLFLYICIILIFHLHAVPSIHRPHDLESTKIVIISHLRFNIIELRLQVQVQIKKHQYRNCECPTHLLIYIYAQINVTNLIYKNINITSPYNDHLITFFPIHKHFRANLILTLYHSLIVHFYYLNEFHLHKNFTKTLIKHLSTEARKRRPFAAVTSIPIDGQSTVLLLLSNYLVLKPLGSISRNPLTF